MLARWIAAGALGWLVGCLEAPPDSQKPADRPDAAGGGVDAGKADAAAICPDLEEPGGQCGDDCTNACVGDVCVVDCTAGPGCHDVIVCAPDFDCEIDCGVADVCIDATIDCPVNHACRISCGGDDSCMNTVVNCMQGPCTITCSGDPQSCREATINCGAGPCTTECVVDQTAPPAVDCSDSCDCSRC